MYEDYKNRMSRRGAYMGEVMRNQSEYVVDATWMNSVSTYPVVIHNIVSGTPPIYDSVDDYEEPIYAHFETKSIYNAGGNEPAYYLTFQPGVIHNNSDIKVGSFVNMPTVDGKCEYWIIININNDNELPRCQILKCTWTLKWIYNNVIYNTLCVLRTGASESIGIETVGQVSTVDSDIFVWVTTNSETQTINYSTRFLISDAGRTVPLAWKTSRIRDVGPIGITRLSLAQDVFDAVHDNSELMLCNYYDTEIAPTASTQSTQSGIASITYSGTKPTVKVGGSFKTFTALFTANGIVPQSWFVNDGTNTFSATTENYTIEYEDNKLKLKVAQIYDLVGNVLTIEVVGTDNSTASVQVEVIS